MEKLLGILEQKINALLESKRSDVELIKALKSEALRLVEENSQLRSQIDALEKTVLARHSNFEEANQERELMKMAVDELIRSIDILFEQQQPSC